MTNSQPSAVPHDQPLYGASFVQAIQRFFRRYATFTGRASRSEFWWVQLFLVLGLLVLLLPGIAIGIATGTTEISPATGQTRSVPGPGIIPFAILAGAFFLGTIVPRLALIVRRLHDANLSGFLVLLILIPYIGGIVVLIFALFGSSPLGARFDAGAATASAAPPARAE